MIEACLVFWKNNGVMRHPVDLLPHCCDFTQPSSSPQRGRGGALLRAPPYQDAEMSAGQDPLAGAALICKGEDGGASHLR